MEAIPIDLYVDESYLVALINDEPIPISDDKFAAELQLQEALVNSCLFQSLSSKPDEEKPSNNSEIRAFFESGGSSNIQEAHINYPRNESTVLELGESSNSQLQEALVNSALELGDSSNSKLQDGLVNYPENRKLEFGGQIQEALVNYPEVRALELGESSNNELQEAIIKFSSFQSISCKPEEEKLTNNPEKRAVLEWRESTNNKLILCGICMELKQTPEIFEGLSECNHSFCIDCIPQYIASKIKEKIVPVECPAPNCNQVVEPGDCSSILPKEVFERWEIALFEASFMGSQKFYCPFKDCSGLMVDDGDEQLTKSECPYCHRLFCANCRVGWHQGVTCEEFESMEKDERQREDIMLMELVKDRHWRRCSNCRFYVEKTEGCLHMTCRCLYEFCYKCGGKWNSAHTC